MKHLFLFITMCLFAISTHAQTKLIKADTYLDEKNGQLISLANILIDDV